MPVDGLHVRASFFLPSQTDLRVDRVVADEQTRTLCVEVTSTQPAPIGIRRDYAAVKAGPTLEWSNGPTEGHVNRLKQVKRQMYGRANLDLLKLRLIA